MARQEGRIVERSDRDDDPAGLPNREPELARAVRGGVDGHRLAMEPRALGGADAEEIGDAGGLSARLGERLSHLERDRLRELVDRAPRRARQRCRTISRALVRRERAHRARAFRRRRERPLRVGRAATGTVSITEPS